MPDILQILRGKRPGEDSGVYTRGSFCDVCSPGPNCGVTCYVKDGAIIRIEGMADHPTNRGRLCTRGLAGRQYVYRKDRVLTPLHRIGARGEGKFAPVSWDEALDEIVYNLNRVKQRYGASAAAFYSGYNKWYRPYLQRLCYDFGSVNYGTESSSCFTSTVMSWRIAAGVDFAAPDLKHAGIFLGWCYNACYSSYLQQMGVEAGRRRGMKVIVIDPRITPAVQQQCDLHLRIRPGTDCALALSLGRELIVNGWTDDDYIRDHVSGFEAYRDYVRTFTPEYAAALTGLNPDDIRLAARMIHENGPLAINQSSAALVHHRSGMQTHRAVMALSALTGSFDRPGGMVPAPLTYAHSMSGFETHSEEFPPEKYPVGEPLPVGADRYPLWQRLVGEMQSTELARQILTGDPYPVRALYAHGMNARMFNGDKEFFRAFQTLDFFADVDLFLTDTAKYADIVLPCCSSFERSEFKVYGGGFGQWTEPVIAPLGQSRQDDEICCELARRFGVDDALLCAGPEACVRYMVRGTGVDIDALKADTQHPHKMSVTIVPVGQHPFRTPSGKFELWSGIIAEYPGLDPLPTWQDGMDDLPADEYPFVLIAGARLPNALHSRLHDVPWLRSLRPTALAEINDADAEKLGLRQGDTVHLETTAGGITVPVLPTYRVLKGTICMYHGYREADVNSIVPPGHNDPYSGFPGYRSVRCRMVPAGKGTAE